LCGGRGGEVGGFFTVITGSTKVFKNLWTTAANNLDTCGCYPRIVGETGGKDFVFVHNSAEVDAVVTHRFKRLQCACLEKIP
jgi:acyl-CoA reductase-like NAD-dependent aldehyde dehydrogenase